MIRSRGIIVHSMRDYCGGTNGRICLFVDFARVFIFDGIIVDENVVKCTNSSLVPLTDIFNELWSYMNREI